MSKSTELIPGSKYNRLTVIRFTHKDKRFRRYYLFKCDCGVEKIIHGTAVTSGNTKSCGCYGKESRRKELLPDNRGVINQIILQYKRHARNRNIDWHLTYSDVKQIISQPCHYCGAVNSNHKVTKNCMDGFDHNGIDRVDSQNGYFIDNVVPACKTCNYAKSDTDYRDFILWLQKASNHTKAMAEQWTKGGDRKSVV